MKDNVIISRRVKLFVAEKNQSLKRDYIGQIYDWRVRVRNASNELLSYLYAKDQLKYYKFIDEKTKLDFGIIGVNGSNIKNDAYALLSNRLKGYVNMGVGNSLAPMIVKLYKRFGEKLKKGESSLPTFKNNIPIPFSGRKLHNIKWCDDSKCYKFLLFGIPFGILLGSDKSKNKIIIERCLSGEYKFCESSLMINDKDNCIYLNLTVKIPIENNDLDVNKVCHAILGVAHPIVAQADGDNKTYEIGTAQEFLYRRKQIQEALKRAQINAKYSIGGKGRKRKCQSVERYHNKEQDYVRTKMHEYSRRLVDYAIKHKCGVIHLCKDEEQSSKDKNTDYLLRNWSYHGLREMIGYKCRKAGIILS